MSALTLLYAEAAVAYVDSVMEWPSTNRPDDVKHRQMYRKPVVDVGPLRMEAAKIVDSHELWHRENAWVLNFNKRFVDMADLAMEYGVGNCGMLAAVAFKWLVEVQQVPCNVSYYGMRNEDFGIHSFLILGETEVPTADYFLNERHPPSSWLSAVWCDPWRRDWFEIKDDWCRRVRMIARDCDEDLIPPEGSYKFRCRAFKPKGAGRITVPHSLYVT